MKRDENVNARIIVDWIVERYSNDQKPLILLTGDIVDDGKTNQYKNAVKILTPLVEAGFPILPTPGNHDYGRWGMNYNEAAASGMSLK